jgi:ankyrin repeat protein
MPLAYEAARRRRYRGTLPPRTSIDAVDELAEACRNSDLSDVQRLAAELGPFFNPDAYSLPTKYHTCQYNRLRARDTLLMTAIHSDGNYDNRNSDRLAVVTLLLDAGADPNLGRRRPRRRTDRGCNPPWRCITPLHLAIDRQKPDIVQALLHAGANPNLATNDPRALPPLHSLRFHEFEWRSQENLKIFDLLLAAGADVNLRDGDGETVLLRLFKPRSYRETENCSPEIVRAFLQAGANPNLGGRTGALPLHYAIAHGDPALVQLLLQAGAHPDAAPPAHTFADREAHLCNYFHPSHVLRHTRKNLLVTRGVHFPYALPEHAIANVEHRQLRCFRETPWQLAILISHRHKFELDVLGESAFPICRSALRNVSLLRQNRAWRKLRAFCRLRYQLFNLYELVCTPDRIDVAADLAAATDGLYAP